jgi:hypothetical protein
LLNDFGEGTSLDTFHRNEDFAGIFADFIDVRMLG